MNARDKLFHLAVSQDMVAEEGARKLLDELRAAVLAEAIEAARSEYLTDATGTDVDNAYNQAVTDMLDALLALAVGGAR